MELIIDFDSIHDAAQREFLINTLRFLNIRYRAIDELPTFEGFDYKFDEKSVDDEKKPSSNQDTQHPSFPVS
ncbi:MAG: hypothetical protein JST21_02490 [Bacteroidetes bacterium]|nr:hypothetical protein [Bacteroidota bacterium]